jgi:hypothetical protein
MFESLTQNVDIVNPAQGITGHNIVSPDLKKSPEMYAAIKERQSMIKSLKKDVDTLLIFVSSCYCTLSWFF